MYTEKSVNLVYLYALQRRGIRPGLHRIRQLVAHLNDPQQYYPVIHVAGTNGKGTTCAIITAILSQAGLQVGLYTSPHLKRFHERICINGKSIDDADINAFIQRHKPIIEQIQATFFEATTALALDYFARKQVDIAVLEVGLGGRFDATNIVQPQMTVITSLAKDHEEYLGNSITQIAAEKAGIIKRNVPCVLAKQSSGLRQFFFRKLKQMEVPYRYAPDCYRITSEKKSLQGQSINIAGGRRNWPLVWFPLAGDFQLTNLQTALTVMDGLQTNRIETMAIIRGIRATKWPGRLEMLQQDPLVLFDVAHNPASIKQVIKTVRALLPERKITILMALKKDKQYYSLWRYFRALNGKIFLTEIPGVQSVPAANLYTHFKHHIAASRLISNPDLKETLQAIHINRKDCLLILGSHHLASTVYQHYQEK